MWLWAVTTWHFWSLILSFVCQKVSAACWLGQTYRVYCMSEDDIATYVSLNWLEISKCPLDMIYPYSWSTHMQKMSSLSIWEADKWALAQTVSKSGRKEGRIFYFHTFWSAPADTVLTTRAPYIYLHIPVCARCSTFKLINLSSLSTLFASWHIIP
jgi:hypothetical protein